jgi:hypothetical protein
VGQLAMTDQSGVSEPAVNDRYRAETEAEVRGWHEFVEILRSLEPQEHLEPGYSTDPDWTIRDVVVHIGTWLAEARIQLERIGAGTYTGNDVDRVALDAEFFAAMRDQPWEVAWIQASASRSRMVGQWHELAAPDEEAAWWFRLYTCDHYREHLARLREWSAELIRRRDREA